MIQLSSKELRTACSYAEKLARRYANKCSYRITYDDLLSAGYEAIAKAAQKNIGDFNRRYFYIAIKNAVLREIETIAREKSWIVDQQTEDACTNIVDTIASDQKLDDDVCLSALAIDIRRQIDKLPARERDYAVLALMQGYDSHDLQTHFQCCRERIRQLKNSVTKKLVRWNQAQCA